MDVCLKHCKIPIKRLLDHDIYAPSTVNERKQTMSVGHSKVDSFHHQAEKRRKIKDETDSTNNQKEEDDRLSSFERNIAQAIQEKQSFLQTLGVLKLKETLRTPAKPPKPKQQHKKRDYKPRERRSERLLRANGINTENVTMKIQEIEEPSIKPFAEKPEMYLFKDAIHDIDLLETLKTDIAECLIKEWGKEKPLSDTQYFSYFQDMEISEHHIAKLVPTRITAMAVHPTTEKLVVVAGSKYGHLSLWDVNAEEGGLWPFGVHNEQTSRLAFSGSQLYSSSYEGSLRCGDLESLVFQRVYFDPEASCSYFDFLQPNSFLISEKSGCIVLVDSRSSKSGGEWSHRCGERPMKTVSIHPVKKDYFIAAHNDGMVGLWDLRNMKKTPLSLLNHSRCVNSAFFSPISGNFILTTSLNNTINTFNSECLGDKMPQTMSITHNNHTGRWLTPFRANWLPFSDEAFVVGCLDQPRRIQVFSPGGALLHAFTSDFLTSITSINVFHPMQAFLAGGNSSGKVFVFSKTDSNQSPMVNTKEA